MKTESQPKNTPERTGLDMVTWGIFLGLVMGVMLCSGAFISLAVFGVVTCPDWLFDIAALNCAVGLLALGWPGSTISKYRAYQQRAASVQGAEQL